MDNDIQKRGEGYSPGRSMALFGCVSKAGGEHQAEREHAGPVAPVEFEKEVGLQDERQVNVYETQCVVFGVGEEEEAGEEKRGEDTGEGEQEKVCIRVLFFYFQK
jgi:hypothetical protein